MPKPLKRIVWLQPISRQHHKALQCCFKIRKGIDKGISFERIAAYVDYFFEDYYHPFLQLKDEVITPLASEVLIKEYQERKKKMLQLKNNCSSQNDLIVFEKYWYDFIRWQERVLLEWIQDNCSDNEIEAVTLQYPINEDWCEFYTDKFWED